MRLRSVLAIAPGETPGEEVLASECDAVLLSLADAGRAVGALRRVATDAFERASAAGKRSIVLANHPRTRLLRDDLDAVVTRHCAAIVLKHAVEPQDARDAAVLLREFEYQREIEPGSIQLFPVIDSARGLLRAVEIAAAVPRIGGLVFDSDIYARDTGARVEEHGPRLAFARGMVVAAARAVDGLPLISGAGADLRQLAHEGFAGAIVADVTSAARANQAFSPPESRVERARRLRDAYAAGRSEGVWVARSGDDVADAAAARKAIQTLEAAGEEE